MAIEKTNQVHTAFVADKQELDILLDGLMDSTHMLRREIQQITDPSVNHLGIRLRLAQKKHRLRRVNQLSMKIYKTRLGLGAGGGHGS